MKKLSLLALSCICASAAHASFTVATFSDPSTGSGTPMFTWDTAANVLSGSWTLPGLTVQTPGLIGGGQVNNAQMAFDSAILAPIINGTYYKMGAGRVRFYTTDINDSFLTITFQSGSFLNPLTAGASYLNADGVSFSGANVPTGLTEQQFAFSFANPSAVGSETKYTASFTSSAVPEPASLLAIGTGLVALARRRRQA